MLTIPQLTQYLQDKQASFEIIEHTSPILSVKDAEKYFDSSKAVPVFIMKTEKEFLALIISARRGRMDFKQMGKNLGYTKFKMADRDEITRVTGYEAGAIPLIGHELPCLMDKQLLKLDFLYGGSGDVYHTLKITPQDIVRLTSPTILTEECFG